MGCDQEVMGPAGFSLTGQMLAYLTIMTVGWGFEGRYGRGGENQVASVYQFFGARLCGAEPELCGNDYACADSVLACRYAAAYTLKSSTVNASMCHQSGSAS